MIPTMRHPTPAECFSVASFLEAQAKNRDYSIVTMDQERGGSLSPPERTEIVETLIAERDAMRLVARLLTSVGQTQTNDALSQNVQQIIANVANARELRKRSA